MLVFSKEKNSITEIIILYCKLQFSVNILFLRIPYSCTFVHLEFIRKLNINCLFIKNPHQGWHIERKSTKLSYNYNTSSVSFDVNIVQCWLNVATLFNSLSDSRALLMKANYLTENNNFTTASSQEENQFLIWT